MREQPSYDPQTSTISDNIVTHTGLHPQYTHTLHQLQLLVNSSCHMSLFVHMCVFFFYVCVVLGRPGVQPSTPGQYGVPAAADGGDEVSPLAQAQAPASESPHTAPQGHCWGHVRCRGHGCYER